MSKVLGMNVIRDRENETIPIDQKDYTEDTLERYGMANCNVAFTPGGVVQRLGRAGIRRFRPRRGHQNSPSGDRTTGSSTWSVSLLRIQLIPPGSWSDMSPVGAIFVPSPPKTGTNLLHSLSPPIVGRVGVGPEISLDQPADRLLDEQAKQRYQSIAGPLIYLA